MDLLSTISSQNYKAILEPIRELFYDSKSSYGIYACELIEELEGEFKYNKYNNISLVGTMPQLELYKQYKITVQESVSKKYKDIQYEFINLEQNKPQSKSEQINFFTTILTPLQVRNIFDVYNDPLKEFINDTFNPKLVTGFGQITYNRVRNKVLENFVLFDLLSSLHQYGITYGQCLKLYDKYKNIELILKTINDNPYVLMNLVNGVGFLKCDKIAERMGIIKNDLRRINACILYVLEQEENFGHTHTPIKAVEDKVKELTGDFEEGKNNLEYFINIINNNEKLILIEDYGDIHDMRVATKLAYNTEVQIKDHLLRLENSDNVFKLCDNQFCNKENLNNYISEFIARQEETQGFKYTEEQCKGFYNLVNYNINIIVGYAGSGKSTLVNGLLNILDQVKLNYILISPTARACKVLHNLTGRDAFTYERALQWTPLGFRFNEYHPLPYSIAISDETGMVGIYNFLNMIRSLKNGSKLIILGDPAQLESISPGSILNDLICSNKFAITSLNKIHRQALESGIIELATKVRMSKCFISNGETKAHQYGNSKDAILIPGKKEVTVNNILKIYKYLLVKGYSFNDIAVLLPMRKGTSGTKEVNLLLRDINNPQDGLKKEIEYGKLRRLFREGDRIINIKNNYDATHYDLSLKPIENDCGIINGDIGTILFIDKSKNNEYVAVQFENDNKYFIILYDFWELQNLELAYAFTCHKFQGASSPIVIMGIDTTHKFMSARSLLYVGITRAESQLYICCDPYIFNEFVKNDKIKYKRTFLKDLLNNGEEKMEL